ncbi:hypothetical protein HMPREF9333_01617 [Johnsonella ignava ATCC 51276]|uniref:HD domain-containing protein n=1 Tax=Johnsonella ignava ATCC 51276 TaxID=679200 RepID=G5GJ77_9FIRM|nr:HD domain-containing protein [Johnsonella ignava]EHI55202.1 hypothetical protein HMPREF9333_01617 [Johnsonella ignava ATCC 51276]
MKFLSTLKEGMRISEIYLCKSRQILLTKAGKEYASLILQDKSGTVDAKIWDLKSPGINDISAMDYIVVEADVNMFNSSLQLNIRRVRKADAGEYMIENYIPVSKYSIESMYNELKEKVSSIKNIHLNRLLNAIFIEDTAFASKFKSSSAAKNVHHSFMGGLMEHSLSVVRLCEFYCKSYPILNRDLLISAALCHDIGKIEELSPFPENDYTDEGQLLGHIIIGCEIISKKAQKIEGFPEKLLNELKHCILSHHGELEYGSPKKPAIIEALALNLADNTDAKLETMKEILESADENVLWLGYNRMFESNIKRTGL